MAVIWKDKLSQSTGGAGIVLTTSNTAYTVHVTPTATAVTNSNTFTASSFDEVWIYAANITTASADLTVGWPNANMTVSIPEKQGLVLVVPGLVAAASSTITSTAGTSNAINVFGFVNRVFQ